MMGLRGRFARTLVAGTAIGALALGASACEGENPIETDVGENQEGGATEEAT